MASDEHEPIPEDPYFWTVDQLAYELCHNPHPVWAAQAKRSSLPTPDIFQKAIRDNVLDGESFMSMEMADMSELDISAFGTKLNIYKIIKFLRSISAEYRRQNIVDQVMPYINGVESPQITGSHNSALPQSAAYYNQTPVRPHNSPHLSKPLAKTPAKWSVSNQQSNIHQPGVDRGLRSVTTLDVHPRTTEIVPTLELTKAVSPSTVQAEETAEAIKYSPENLQADNQGKNKRRLAPTFISHNTQDRIDIFNTNRSRRNGRATTFDEDTDTEHKFVLGKSQLPFEHRKYVAGVMKGRLPRAAQPTPTNTKKNHFSVEEQQPLDHVGTADDLSEDFLELLARYPVIEDDDGYAPFGESGDEGEYDEETWDEIQAEIEENKHLEKSAGTLSQEEVDTAIDEAIADIEVEWRERKFPSVQNKGCRMWKKATRLQTGSQYIKESNFWINRFESAIGKICAAISQDTWHRKVDVKAQSRSLEESIFQREEHKHYVSILRSNEEPTRPDKLTFSRAKKTIRPVVPEGEELLESDSERWSDDSFIEDDTSDTGSIPYEGPISKARPTKEQVADDSEPPAIDSSDANSDSMSIAEEERPMANEEPAKSIEETSSDESDDQIISAGRRRTAHTNMKSPTPPSRLHPKSQRTIEAFDDSDTELDSDLDAPTPLPKTRFRKIGTQSQAIELMSSSPSAPEPDERHTSMDSICTPELNPGSESPRPRKKHVLQDSSHPSTPLSNCSSSLHLKLKSSAGDGPSLDDVEAIRELEWGIVESDEDHRRALAKAVYELDADFAVKLNGYVEKILVHPDRVYDLLKEILPVCNRLDLTIDTVSSRDQHLARCLGLLFLTYDTAIRCMDGQDLSDDIVNDAFEAVDAGSEKFFVLLRLTLEAFCVSKSLQKRQGKKRKSDDFDSLDELIDDSDILMAGEDQDQEHTLQSLSRSARKRKKKVLQSREAESQQMDDRARVAEQEKLRTAMLEKMSRLEDNADHDIDLSSLHPVSFKTPTVYLDSHIGRKVKPHQESGIQFMWREICAGKGCILAHTMGLGKTMQVISLLITIAQASKSEELEIQAQVPDNLQLSRTLILCPPTLIDNWHDEIMMWTPPGSLVLGEVRKVTSATPKSQRMKSISRWALGGGILLMSYALFKQIVEKKSKSIPQESRASFADKLTSVPSIVVADEAHHMKNPKSGIAQAAKLFTTKARIALTGSPLSNHLEEYHQMIDWVSPGYLGSLVQFKAKYSEPIKAGLYADSSASERRLSTRKLMVLKRDLEPKICRADISAIAKDMPNKAEFFITIPLTAVQKDAYTKYVKYMLRENTSDSGQAKLWAWLGVLSLLLNHPSAFVQKLLESNKSEVNTPEGEREASVGTDDLGLPADVPVSDTGLSTEAIDDILSVFNAWTEEVLYEVQHSYRSMLTAQIVQECMRIREKVLIFSHSLPTLDYLEKLLNGLSCTYARIDGSTTMSARQDMVKNFNKRQDIQVMLISTRAGGLGVNLQGANRVIIYDFNFNPTWEEQAIGRAYRLGQRKHVFVYRFRAGGTFEETVYNMSIFKTQLFARVVDKRNPMRFASKNVSDYLFPPKELGQSELHGCRGTDTEVLDLIMERESCIRKVEFTETFQVEEDDELTPEEIKQAEQEYQDEVLARTDPGKLLRLQNERYIAATQQIQNARVAQQQQQLTAGHTTTSQQAYSRAIPTPYSSLPNDLRQTQFYPMVDSPQPRQPLGSQDDMYCDGFHIPSPKPTSLDAGPRAIGQLDGQDERINCNPQ